MKELIAITGTQLVVGLVIFLTTFIPVPAQALVLPDTGEANQWLDNTAFQTRIIKLDYTLLGNLAYLQSRGAGTVMLADGSSQDLSPLYKPKQRDIEALFITKLVQGEYQENRLYQVNLLWGGSTGQESNKLYVQPSVKLGILTKVQTSEASLLTFSVQRTIGGYLKERPCTADYGVAGSYQVKCSLASSTLPPQETLKYLQHRAPVDATIVKVSWEWYFN